MALNDFNRRRRVRVLAIHAGDLGEAVAILDTWAGAVDGGMVPNLFVEEGGEAKFNSVDASLWFIVATYELLREFETASLTVPAGSRRRLFGAIEKILATYRDGTRYGIGMDQGALDPA